ncbi:hypothetical protein [Solitalea canadensis]|uniref:Uncharacterized protein n=1 Tax=Solitalea canadensis (strain ATCC 29591 / DSM 3403 / JCM 21819 / LMG 8368 / NBRC 15130 / NCIMB 12057 / USAM 9D) TaxID=929556 RepID=H8KQE7_SOLCM|nr:hypothetical protein [Solitalea canadensis]AFD06563.1 hypothetical protein Solca_1486 [Solitalea canadensis DSM 3403]
MKKLIMSLIIIGFIAGLSVLAFGREGLLKIIEPRDVRVLANNVDSLDYAQFKKDAQEKIQSNDKDIADLKAKMKSKAKEGNAKASSRYSKKIEDLEAKNDDLRQRITDYKYNNSDWSSFKQKFDHDMYELSKAFKGLTSKK